METVANAIWAGRPNAPAPGARLGPLEAVADGGAKEYVFGAGINRFRMFVVRRGCDAYGYLNLCPHYSLPLNHREDEFLTRGGDSIMCRQHLALFRIEDGACLGGACEGRALEAVPVRVEQGALLIGGGYEAPT
jgi:nitrite reductase/ring-hydroxylating ferredoxin subunit